LIGISWPKKKASAKEQPDVAPVADLDAIIADPIPFRFKGKIHYIKPIELGEFMKFANAQVELSKSSEVDSLLTAEMLAKRYHKVVSSVCDSISLDDIMEMSQAQIAALYQLVVDAITGQVETGDVKKKRMRIPIYEYARQSSSKNAAPHSDGRQDKR